MRGAAPEIAAARDAWRQARLAPLWESPAVGKPPPPPVPPRFWSWDVLRPAVEQAMVLAPPSDVERRVLLLTDPASAHPEDPSTTVNIAVGLQALLPGESARPHRHTMSALRLILEGGGAVTLVDGKSCPMEEGDLVLTPGWCWHEHVHSGTAPTIWLDALDSPLHRHLGTARFEPGPPNALPPVTADAAFAVPGMLPEISADLAASHSPRFRYPYEAAAAAVAVAPPARDGSRRVRYVNPMNGTAVLPLMDCHLVQLDESRATVPMRTGCTAICAVLEGSGETRVGDQLLSWGRKDIFILPPGHWISHRGRGGSARLFVLSDRELFARLGLLREEYRDSTL
jgi:gentisate 1,2-dioxygenase